MNFLKAEVEIAVDDSKLSAQLKRVKGAVSKTVDKIKGSFRKMGASVQAVFGKMVRYAKLAMAAIAIASIKAFASFDDAMQKSVAIMKGVTGKLRLEMEKVAKAISLDSVKSATELARSYFYLASAGLTVEQSIKALSKVEAFAVAGAFDMATATDLITDAQSALGLAVDDTIKNMENMERISDVLIGANTLANASTQQFSEALMRAGPIMKSYGIELEEGVAVLAAYADQGKKAAEGGELFGRMLRLMIKGFVDNRAAWKSFGISIVDADDKMRPLADIVRDLTDLLDGMGVTQKAVTLETLGFAARSQQTIMPLLGMADAIEEYNKELKEMGGITQRVRDFQLKSFASQMKIVWNNIVSIGIAIGERLAPHIEALGNFLKKNREVIKGWSVVFVDRILYVKNVLWAFIKFMKSDWKAGIKFVLDVAIILFKVFGKSLVILMKDFGSRAAHAFVNSFGVKIAKGLARTKQKIDMFVMGAGYQKWAQQMAVIKPEHIKGTPFVQEGPTTTEKLKGVWGEAGAEIKAIAPPDLQTSFDVPKEQLIEGLGEVKTAVDEAEESMKNAFIETPKKSTEVTNEAVNKLKSWGDAAKNVWSNLADVATSALDSTADALANLVIKGKADFRALAESILMDLTRVIIKAMIAQVLLGAVTGGGGGLLSFIPGLQHGGEVKKTGLAVVHKGETYSGVQGEGAAQEAISFTMNVNAIDAGGTYQFLNKNKRAIATMLQGTIKSNHPIRKATSGWK